MKQHSWRNATVGLSNPELSAAVKIAAFSRNGLGYLALEQQHSGQIRKPAGQAMKNTEAPRVLIV
jgi:hypothetical protein